jgi:hypothetical protein
VKMIAALVGLCALSQAAHAQTPECKSIADPSARLACYDRINPAAASSAAARPGLRAPPARKAGDETYIDLIGAEDAVVNARMKNICRGC